MAKVRRYAIELLPGLDPDLLQSHVRVQVTEPRPDRLLEYLQGVVDGYIEVVYPDPIRGLGHVMIVNDCGALNDLPFNLTASWVAGSPIYGPAVLVSTGMVQGEPDLVLLTGEECSQLCNSIRRLALARRTRRRLD